MTALLIDDEPRALAILGDLLAEFCPDVNVLATATNVADALALIATRGPDLLFLDIDMPVQNGFDLIEQLPPADCPEVIFVTGERDFALRAIQVSALGYVTKPIALKDLLQAVTNARRRHRNATPTVDRRLEELLANHQLPPDSRDRRLAIPGEREIEYIPIREIVQCEGDDRATRIHLLDGRTLLSSYSLGYFAGMLKEDVGFLRIHKSHLVNTAEIRRYLRSGAVVFSDASQAPVARRRRDEVQDYLKRAGG